MADSIRQFNDQIYNPQQALLKKKLENILIPYQAVREIPGNCALVFAPHPDDEVFGCG